MQCFHNQLNKALPIDSQHDLGVLWLAGQLIVVADRFATRQLTGRFNIDVHFFGLEHLWFNQPGNRARIVQRCSLKAPPLDFHDNAQKSSADHKMPGQLDF